MWKQTSSNPDLQSIHSHLSELLNNVQTPCRLGSDLNHVESAASQRVSMLKRDAKYIQALLSHLNGFQHRFDGLVEQLGNKIDEDSAVPHRVSTFLDEPLFGELTDAVTQLKRQLERLACDDDEELKFQKQPVDLTPPDGDSKSAGEIQQVDCGEIQVEKNLTPPDGDSKSAGEIQLVDCGVVQVEMDLTPPDGDSKSAGEIQQVDCGEIQVEMDLPLPDRDSESTSEISQVNLNVKEPLDRETLEAKYNELHDAQKKCLWCFSVFPENAAIKKRVLIYWWIGEELIGEEKLADEIFKALEHFIEPVEKQGRITNSCKLKPPARSFVISMAKAGNFILSDENDELRSGQTCRTTLMRSEKGFSLQKLVQHKPGVVKELKTMFNVDETRIGIESETFADMKSLQVLHLGRSHSNDLIVLKDTKFMERLIKMKQLRLLSLQGIASVRQLPDSGSLMLHKLPLRQLLILDLRACNALESLPLWTKRLKHLTHLDVSACHSLIHMPKGICLLPQLQVLKGFVVRKKPSCWKRLTTCTLHDLLMLKKLERLSLCILEKDFPKSDDVRDIANMKRLIMLKMVWRTPPLQEQEEGDVCDQEEEEEQQVQVETTPGTQLELGQEEEGQSELSAACRFEQGKEQEEGELPDTSTVHRADQGEEEEEQQQQQVPDEMIPGAQLELGQDEEVRSELLVASRFEQGKEQEEEDRGEITYMSRKWRAEQGEEDEGPSEPATRDLLSHETMYPVENGEVERDPAEQTTSTRRKRRGLRNTDEVVQLRKLEKLDLWCLPQEAALELLDPIKFPRLKKLYIRGSHIQTLHHNHAPGQQGKWNVETSQLMYLRNLKISKEEMNGLFPELSYLGKLDCPGLDFPCNGEGFWRKEGI